MNTALNRTTSRPTPQGVNPFARALAEARGGQGSTDQTGLNPNQIPGMDSAAMGGGNGWMNEAGQPDLIDQQQNFEEQQRLQLEKQRKDRLRQQLHREINPVEATAVYNRKEEQVTKQIEEVRHELKMLVKEVAEFSADVEIAVLQDVVNPGTDGSYYFTFFKKLKEFIILLRKKIHSARTWATAVSSKKKKKKNAPGLEISGKSHEQTATVFDRMHHERSTLYSGS